MKDEDFLPDFRPDTVWAGVAMGLIWAVLPIWGVLDKKTVGPPSYATSAFIFVATMAWFAFHWVKRGKGYLIGEKSLERIEHGITVWTLGWKSVVARPKGSRVEVQDLTGHTWGRLCFDLGRHKSGRIDRVLLARLLSKATRVEWRLPTLAQRRRRYAIHGSLMLVIGLALTVPSVLRLDRMFSEAAHGTWLAMPNTVATFAILIGLPALLLGVLDLRRLVTDRKETANEPPHIAYFIERPVPIPVDLAPGRWYRYRDQDRAQRAIQLEMRALRWLMLSPAMMFPLVGVALYRLHGPGDALWGIVVVSAVSAVSAGVMSPLYRLRLRPLSHRFRRVGDVLEVDTGKELKRYPWHTAKDKMVKARGSSWMSGYTTFGKGFRSYNLDRCWVEPEDKETSKQVSE